MSASRDRSEPALDRAQRDELLRIAARRARGDGTAETAIPFLSLLRAARPTSMRHGIIAPSLCIVLQGDKRLLVGRDTYDYGPGWYVMSALEFPTAGQIIRASQAVPYLALRLVLDVRACSSCSTSRRAPRSSPDRSSTLADEHDARAARQAELTEVMIAEYGGPRSFSAASARSASSRRGTRATASSATSWRWRSRWVAPR